MSEENSDFDIIARPQKSYHQLNRELDLLRTENERLKDSKEALSGEAESLANLVCGLENDLFAKEAENERLKAEINTLKAIDSGRNEALTITAKERDQAIHKVAELEGALGNLHDAAIDAFNFIGGAKPPATKDEIIEDLKETASAARKALEGK